MEEKVTAEVILRSTDGSSILDAKGPITAENVAMYRVGEKIIDEASRKLGQLDFEVLQVGPTSITISVDKRVFESTFQTTLQRQSIEIMGTKVEGTGISFYKATEPIKVPKELSSLIADVVLPTPPEFYP